VNRRDFLKGAGAGLACTAVYPNILKMALNLPKRPNILFLFSDDHACQSISAYGGRLSSIAPTRNIDRIASEGALFKRNFCANSICAPSRACVLTGKHSNLNGQRTNGDTFDGSQQTFPKLFQQAGYKTALIGKWHLRSTPTGFDHWMIYPGQGDYYNPEYITPEGKKQITGYSVEVTTDLALDWMKQQEGTDKPFLMMCQYKVPHRTWMPGPKYLHLFDDITIPEPDTLFDDYSGRTSSAAKHEMGIDKHMQMTYDLKVPMNGQQVYGVHRMNEEQKKLWNEAYDKKNEEFLKANLQGKDLVRWKYQRYMKDYLRCIRALDDNIGRILDYLEKSGLDKNTLVMYSSDQGFYLGEHGWFDKRWMYEESFSMPLVMKWPGVIKPGSKISGLTQNIDFAPTFLAAAGLSVPKDIQGESMIPLFEGKTPEDWRKSLYYHYYEQGEHNVARHYGVRTENYKLIRFYDTDEWELFDLQKDPKEMKSVYDDPAYHDIREQMKVELDRLRKKYGDTYGEPLKHDDFNELIGISAISGGGGKWVITADGDACHALKKTGGSYRKNMTLKCRIKSARESGIMNGFLAFGPGKTNGELLRCGIYIGAGEYIILKDGTSTVTEKKADFAKNDTFDVTVNADIQKKTVEMTVNGVRLLSSMPSDWSEINYYGPSLNRTATEFSDLVISGE